MLGDEGFEVVGGSFDHVPLVHADENNSTAYEWHRSMLQEQEHEHEPEATEEDEEDVEPKEYINDETLTFVDPEDSERNLMIEKSCGANEMPWSFKFLTDEYGFEMSWKLEHRVGNVWTSITYGPPTNMKYNDNTVYQGATCLTGDEMYKLTIMDAAEDGLCCSYGKGTYSYKVNGVNEFDSDKTKSFTDKSEHSFYVGLPVPENNGNGNTGANENSPIFLGRSSICGNNKQEIMVTIKTDKYGAENAWKIVNTRTQQIVIENPKGTLPIGAEDTVTTCVSYGEYQFTITDGAGDGICCGAQGDGYYKLYMDGELMVNDPNFTYGKTRSHIINVGYHTQLNQMGQREIQYLNCHNWRRKKYHERFGAQYVPLKYDMSLADDAKSWSTELLDDCEVNGIIHEPGVEQGENLAKNTGSALGSYGRQYPVENICRRWFEREETWGFPDNAHLTQGLWRSALYVGCAESTKTMDNGGLCHVQVCRYARAGNCAMGQANAKVGDNWKIPMLADDNRCGPICPPNGCH